MGKSKKGFNEWITLAHTKFKRKEDRKISWKGVIIIIFLNHEHKKNEKKEKIAITSLMLPKAPKRLPFAKWS
jgi:hypothetical protein